MQFRDSIWVPFENFFQVEEGRLVEDEEVTEIVMNMSTS